MRLIRARVRNYRGIREADLNFHDLTVLIGENGCGKSSLLNALETCLGRKTPPGSFDFQQRDIHLGIDSGTRPIQISLSFREDKASKARLLEPLRAAGLCARKGLLDFKFQVRAIPLEDGFKVDWRMGREDCWKTEEGLLHLLREACPFVRIRCGGLPVLGPVRAASESPVVEQIRSAFRSVMESKSPPPGLLEEVLGYLQQFLKKFEKEGTVTSLQDRLEAPMNSPTDSGWLFRHLQGSGIQSLALLAMAAMFIEGRGPGPLDEESRPLITLEDPEVHLHPLASRTVWSLLNPLSAQKLITTNSPDLLGAAPLGSLRRMVRAADGHLEIFGPNPELFDERALRRAAYHVRVRRASSLFMRGWLLVEGESDFWLLNEVARVCGYELAYEGVACVEFAQSGLGSLVKLAAALGIRWHVLCDGDQAGLHYRKEAEALMHLGGGTVFQLREKDLENCLWRFGYEDVYRRAAGMHKRTSRKNGRKHIIKQAVRNVSKPHLALIVAEEIRARGLKGVPPELQRLLKDVISSARDLDPVR